MQRFTPFVVTTGTVGAPGMGRRMFVTLIAAVALLVPAATADGAVEIGSDLTATRNSNFGATPVTFSQTVLPGRQVVAPFDGVVVSWRISQGAAGPINLRVLRRTGAAFTEVAVGPTQMTSGSGLIEGFPVALPIRAGDYLGVDQHANGQVGFHDGTPTTGAVTGFWNPILGPTETREPSPANHFELLMNALIEPDADCDGLGDESQDPAVSGGCLAAPPSVHCKGQATTIVGTPGNDTLTGTPGRDVIAALEGNDRVSGLAGRDLICGGDGRDTLKGGRGKDKLLGQQGADRLKGGGGNDTCKGGGGRDEEKSC